MNPSVEQLPHTHEQVCSSFSNFYLIFLSFLLLLWVSFFFKLKNLPKLIFGGKTETGSNLSCERGFMPDTKSHYSLCGSFVCFQLTATSFGAPLAPAKQRAESKQERLNSETRREELVWREKIQGRRGEELMLSQTTRTQRRQ